MGKKWEYKIVQFSDYTSFVNGERKIVIVEDGRTVEDVDWKMRKIKDRNVYPKRYSDQLCKLGLQGWEMVACYGLQEFTDQILIFKRPIEK